MGGAMGGHLAAAGFAVCGFDIDADKRRSFAGEGLSSTAEVVRRSDIVLLSLPSSDSLEDVSRQIAEATDSSRPLVVEMGTLPLEVKQRAQSRLADAGVELLDAPVSGTGLQAADATLVIYASGTRSGYEAALDVFDTIAARSYHLGEFGNGTRMKFVANLLVAVNTLGAAEAHALGDAAGLPPELTQEVIGAGVGSSRMFEIRGPMMVNGRYDPAARLSTIFKDAGIISEFARSLGTSTPLLDAALPLYRRGVACDLGELDAAALRLLFNSSQDGGGEAANAPRLQAD